MRFYAIQCDGGRARKKTAKQQLWDLPLESAKKNTFEDSGAAGGGVLYDNAAVAVNRPNPSAE